MHKVFSKATNFYLAPAEDKCLNIDTGANAGESGIYSLPSFFFSER
jgi:hypothetical protein